jgi:hypothetical protein
VFENMKNFHAESKLKVALKAYLANFTIQGEYEKTLSSIF